MSNRRTARYHRVTNETDVSCDLLIDGSGQCDINTGISFFDHMLEQLSKHSLMNITLKAKGDLHVDQHHTVEDVGLVIGKTLHKALGDAKGIERYAHTMLPMDETLTTTALDVSGRPFLCWNVDIPGKNVGGFDTELVHEWFRAFVQEARITLHIQTLYGRNTHHIVESCYKSLAITMRKALQINMRSPEGIPSTKGNIS